MVNLGGGGQRFEKYMPFYYGDFDIFINAIYNGKWYVYTKKYICISIKYQYIMILYRIILKIWESWEILFSISYHIATRRKMLAEGNNGPIPKMPFDKLCDLIGDAINSVPSEKVIKTFKQTLFSLPIDGSRDEAEGSKKLLKLIAGAPSIDQIPEKYKLKVSDSAISFMICPHEVDDSGILRRKEGAAEKYKNRVFNCKLCGWAYSNKYAAKAKKHQEQCPAFWIYESWKPQKLEALKFVKS